NEILVAMKGAPENVKDFLINVPGKYIDFERYASKGYRVLALAYKTMKKEHLESIITREETEKDLLFGGFALYNSKLKDKAKETVDHLMSSGHKVLMITGDNAKT